MPIPLDTRKKPTDVKVHVSTGAGVDVTWSDGHTSHYDFVYLREWCPCATCNDERMKKEEATQRSSAAGSPASAAGSAGVESDSSGGIGGIGSSLLPMYKPKARARSAKAIGNYALQIEFTDGHSTGIYSFTYLREICPCDVCAREFRG